MEMVYKTTDFDQYYLDFHDTMRESELSLPKYYMRSPQLDMRCKLIEFTKTLCTERMLSRTTLHLSRYLLDTFMDTFEVAEERLRLFACVCVLLAAKLEERSDLIPRWRDLKQFLETMPSTLKSVSTNVPGLLSKEYAIFECMILNTMRWKLSVPTAATFIEYYIVASLTIRDVPIRLRCWPGGKRSQNYTELRLRMYNLIYYLLDMSLSSLDLIGALPSKLAAASILCARHILHYRPFWTAELHQITGYAIEDVVAIAKLLREQYLATLDLDIPICLGKRPFPFDNEDRVVGRVTTAKRFCE